MPIKSADGAADFAAVFPTGCLGDVLNGAAHGVLAKQRALRTAQHFDALDVQHALCQQAIGRRLPDTVDIDRHTRQAANAKSALRLAGGAATEHRQVGDNRVELAQRFDAAALQLGATDCRDGDRHLLQRFFATTRGYDDF